MTELEELQYLFDKSSKHILAQGKASTSDEDPAKCVFKNEQGLGCAFAPFILKYNKSMDSECFSATDVIHKYKSSVDPIAVKHSNICDALQECHDEATPLASDRATYDDEKFMNAYKKNLQRVAVNYKLRTFL
jgi:hypothetical protein